MSATVPRGRASPVGAISPRANAKTLAPRTVAVVLSYDGHFPPDAQRRLLEVDPDKESIQMVHASCSLRGWPADKSAKIEAF
eukprot:5909677-Pleurochrysis_carterae.AAC.1